MNLHLELPDEKFEEAQDAWARTSLALCTDVYQPGKRDYIPSLASGSSSQATQLVLITNSPHSQKCEQGPSIVSLTWSTLIKTYC